MLLLLNAGGGVLRSLLARHPSLTGVMLLLLLRIAGRLRRPARPDFRSLSRVGPMLACTARVRAWLLGLEIDSDLADSGQSVILDQVTNGLAVRMAVLYLCGGLARR